MPSAEGACPPPRQKSCTTCIKAKRRCSLDKPTCDRCSQRHITCQYIAESSKERHVIKTKRRSKWLAPRLEGSSTKKLDRPASPTVDKLASCGSLSARNTGTYHAEDFIANMGNGRLPRSDKLSPFMSDWSRSNLEMMIRNPAAGELSRPLEYRYVSQLISTRVQYIMDTLQDAPRSMVVENQTPWCHSLLYRSRMPRSIQDAQAMCSLYLHKNNANCAAIMSSIESRVVELVGQPMPTDRLDILARAQSLVLYQVIRLFDGEISAVAAIQDSISAMAVSARALGRFLTDETPKPISMGSTPSLPAPTDNCNIVSSEAPIEPFHYNWLLDESIRRTYIVTFFFLQIYRMLLLHLAPVKHANNICESFTISSHLWDAPDSVSFASAWNSKNHVRFEGHNVDEVLSLHGGDVDKFSKMLLTLMMGIEETKAWLSDRGGEL